MALAKASGLVTVATYSSTLEASIGRAKLAAHGIRGFIPDEHLSTMNPQYMAVAGGVRLQVHRADAAQAEDILSEQASSDDDDDDIEDGPPCPSCGKRYASQGLTGWQSLFAVILLGIPLLFLNKRWICGKCRHSWRAQEDPAARAHPYRVSRKR